MLNQTIDNRYLVERQISQGSMGVIYEAKDTKSDRRVAMKVMHRHLASHKGFQRLFQTEAETVARFDHPNIVRVLHYSTNPQRPYIVMELIEGGSLRQYMRGHPKLSYEDAIFIMAQIARALHYAHSQRVIHRDVKPENILLKPTPVQRKDRFPFDAMLTDFGLAKLRSTLNEQTRNEQAVGTHHYMSPEQFSGKIDERADVYALGIVLYEITLGQKPFEPQNALQAYQMHVETPVPLPRSIQPDYPAELENLILKCLAKRPEDRYRDAGELEKALLNLQLASVLFEPAEPTRKRGRQRKRQTIEAPADGGDYIILKEPGSAEKTISITKPVMSIGRDPQTDIVLDNKFVSRRHALLERDDEGVYRIRDLTALNQSRLSGKRLIKDVAEKWEDEQVLYIGEVKLTLHHGEMSPQPNGNRQQDFLSMTGGVNGGGGSLVIQQPIVVSLTPANLKIDPGQSAEVTVSIANQDIVPDEVKLDVRGVPGDWSVIDNDVLKLDPAMNVTTKLRFSPPRNWDTTASRYTYTLRVYSQRQQAEAEKKTGVLHITPYEELSLTLQPERLRDSGMTIVTIKNTGNVAMDVLVKVYDPENALRFALDRTRMTVQPGRSEQFQLEVAPKPEALVHGARLFPFTVNVSSPDGVEKVARGEIMAVANIIRREVYQAPPPVDYGYEYAANGNGNGAAMMQDPMQDVGPIQYETPLDWVRPMRSPAMIVWLSICTFLILMFGVALFDQGLRLLRLIDGDSSYVFINAFYMFIISMVGLTYTVAVVLTWRWRLWAAVLLVALLALSPIVALNLPAIRTLPGCFFGAFVISLAPVGWFIIQEHLDMFG